MAVASARPYRERQPNQTPRALATGTAWAGLCLIHHHQTPRAPGQRARGEGCSFWTSQNAASLKEKLDCALAAGWQWGGHGMGGSKAPGYLHLSFRGRGTAIQMPLTNLPPLGRRKSCWRGGSTASHQLSEVKHVPAQVALWLATTLKPCAAFRQLSEVKHVPALRELNPGPTSAFSLPRWW